MGGFIIFEGVLSPSLGDVAVVGAVVVAVVEGIRNLDIGSWGSAEVGGGRAG